MERACGYSEGQIQSMSIHKLKRIFRIPRNARFTRTALVNKLRKKGLIGRLADWEYSDVVADTVKAEARRYYEGMSLPQLRREARIKPQKGINKLYLVDLLSQQAWEGEK